MVRLAVFAALLAQLQPVFASFYTVTSYYVLSTSTSKYISTCTSSCRAYTDTETLTVNPTVTPTASPISSRTSTYTYDDVEVVRLYLPAGAVADSDIVTTTSTRQSGIYTEYAIPITWTAPSSCPTPFTVVTMRAVDIPYQVTRQVSAVSTATSVYTNTRSKSTVTYITYILNPTAIPATQVNPTTYYDYINYVRSCRNPTATGGAEFYGPSYTARGGSGSSSSSGDDDDDWDWTVCSALTGCVGLATWIIVIATILPTIFVLGFVESYFWFRRMMLGKSALRLGTVCWCCLSLWFILLTRKSPTRSAEDQVLLKQYWATLGAGERIKLWFKWGFRWRYPVELLGNPEGGNPVVGVQPLPQVPPGDGSSGDGSEKMGDTAQQQSGWMPYPGQQQPQQQPYPGQAYMQPYPGQPGFAQPPPQGAYVPGQQPGFVPTPPPPGSDGQSQQQLYPPYVPTPSPVQTATTDVPSVQPTMTPPPPVQAHELQQPSSTPPAQTHELAQPPPPGQLQQPPQQRPH